MIRPATLADVDALTALAGELGYPNEAEAIASRLAALRTSGNDEVFVFESDGEVEGWMHVRIAMSLESGASAEIRGLVVTERSRGHGVGAQLVRAAEEWARERGMPRLRVRTNVNRARAHAFYEREGFALKKTSRVYEKAIALVLAVVIAAACSGETRQVDLPVRLKEICARAGGVCAVAVTHVETGRSAGVEHDRAMPLYSVFKLPLAVAVLKDVEEGKLRLDQEVRVELWTEPADRTIEELLELSIVRSDNTSTDRMLELVGGPEAVTRRMRALGLQNITVLHSAKEVLARADHPNRGTAADLARLLVRLQKGEALAPPQRDVLLGFMQRAVTGKRRLRAGPPAGTPVFDKTGTGPSTTNDVGIITLPNGRGHLALAVLLDGSTLPPAKQEDVIAEIARVAYDYWRRGGG